MWGCDSQSDCLPPTYCAYCHSCGPWANNCMVRKFTPCKAHLGFCRWNEQCCSGKCGRRGWFTGVCLPVYRGGSGPITKEVNGEGEDVVGEGKEVLNGVDENREGKDGKNEDGMNKDVVE